MTNQLRKPKRTITALILIAFSAQTVSFGVFGQSLKNGVTKEKRQNQMEETRRGKVAPDLEEQTDKLSRGVRGDEWQSVRMLQRLAPGRSF